jgi:hypothetical protein
VSSGVPTTNSTAGAGVRTPSSAGPSAASGGSAAGLGY